MTEAEVKQIEIQFDLMRLEEQLLLIERLLRRVRHGATVDREAFARELQEMANDPELLRELGMGGDEH
jgi:hypothetical protein